MKIKPKTDVITIRRLKEGEVLMKFITSKLQAVYCLQSDKVLEISFGEKNKQKTRTIYLCDLVETLKGIKV